MNCTMPADNVKEEKNSVSHMQESVESVAKAANHSYNAEKNGEKNIQ